MTFLAALPGALPFAWLLVMFSDRPISGAWTMGGIVVLIEAWPLFLGWEQFWIHGDRAIAMGGIAELLVVLVAPA